MSIKRFWIWNNARLVINIDAISLIKVTAPPPGYQEDEKFEVHLDNDDIEILDNEQLQSLMNFINENNK